MEKNRENYIYSNIEDGFLKLQKGKVVMHAIMAMAKGTHRSDPYSTPPNIKIFGPSKSSYYNLIFTKNSPLLPMFKKATITSFETGKYNRISLKWQGDEIKSNGEMDMVLSSGQVFNNFIFLVAMFVICSGCFCLFLEVFYFHTFDKTFISKGNFQKGKLQTEYKIRRHST